MVKIVIFQDPDSSIKQTLVEANGVTLDVVEQGDGPAVSFGRAHNQPIRSDVGGGPKS